MVNIKENIETDVNINKQNPKVASVKGALLISATLLILVIRNKEHKERNRKLLLKFVSSVWTSCFYSSPPLTVSLSSQNQQKSFSLLLQCGRSFLFSCVNWTICSIHFLLQHWLLAGKDMHVFELAQRRAVWFRSVPGHLWCAP